MAPPCEVRGKGMIPLPRSVLAEFAGTLALVLIGCGSCAGGDQGEAAIDDQANTVRPVPLFLFSLSILSYLTSRCESASALGSSWPPWPRVLATSQELTLTLQSLLVSGWAGV